MLSQFLKLLSEESDGTSSKITDKEHALTNTVDAFARCLESSPVSSEDTGMILGSF